jgi:AraC family transcriptional regulator
MKKPVYVRKTEEVVAARRRLACEPSGGLQCLGAQMQPSHPSKKAVGRVIESMHRNLAEQLTLDEMARTAMFSKFHFTRLFQRVTGISPGRFLAAVRLHQAKQLLTSTSLSVTEITHRVGYSSVGTFSSRFSSSVGVSPRAYRRRGRVAPPVVPAQGRAAGDDGGIVHGEVHGPEGELTGPIFVGLFPTIVHEGRPASGAVLPGPGPFTLRDVPAGQWYVLAHSRAPRGETDGSGDSPPIAFLGSYGPISIDPGATMHVALHMRMMGVFDPPILLAVQI